MEIMASNLGWIGTGVQSVTWGIARLSDLPNAIKIRHGRRVGLRLCVHTVSVSQPLRGWW